MLDLLKCGDAKRIVLVNEIIEMTILVKWVKEAVLAKSGTKNG